MVYPAIEVTVVTVGNRTIEDETTEDGQKYQKAFHAAATTIPGCSRGCWGRSDKYPDKVIHFIDYDTRKQHDIHKTLINGPTPPILLDVQSDETVYVIHPNTNDRTKVYYAPYTTVTFFWGIDEEKWTDVAPEFFAAVAKSDSCTGYIWGEVDKPILADFNGYASLGSGKCGILITGWRSKAQHDRETKGQRVTKAWDAVQKVCAKADDWGTSLRITENTGHIHRWTTPLPLKDRSDWLPAAGLI
ncbi:hypothetical protein N5P37_004295 [Trichoderma harzianum]|uniref:Uncharacterized protein n=1 Tax=Trichoderma harzianum CBS 226.95 TaxID=983964 RepID=A0A2T4AN46_TRIHA|nr:hypothetical protein M431DRAFT_105676 [Trichoderma harzianum CBS 226.95]KAK0763308.1 hypothetical protein N5P37_004295 [Trichoderma harzianum]PKK43529.1 hypothetical protein CI102_12141 [Trichoderma harzianum]PTB58479.1 hypothetical protein M431DRAFT_105676 [Trichoderma harzianum CBS 226.95]